MSPIRQVKISLQASNLSPKKFSFKKISPYAIVYVVSPTGNEKIIGATEFSSNFFDPDWFKVYIFNYHGERNMKIKIDIFDWKATLNGLSLSSLALKMKENSTKYKKLATTGHLNIDDILVDSKSYSGTFAFSNSNGSIKYDIERISDTNKDLCFALQLRGIDCGTEMKGNISDKFHNRNFFFEISKRVHISIGKVWEKLYRSEIVFGHTNPIWKECIVHLAESSEIKIVIHSMTNKGLCTNEASILTTVEELIQKKSRFGNADLRAAFTLVTRKHDGYNGEHSFKRKEKQFGKIVVLEAMFKKFGCAVDPTLDDFMNGGCEINSSIAIDFSAHNGDISVPGTPHYIIENESPVIEKEEKLNKYQKAISFVIGILAKYDSHHTFPVFGFGLSQDNVDLQLFQCGLDKKVNGIVGILDAYDNVRRGGFVPSSKASLVQVIRAKAKIASFSEAALDDADTREKIRKLSYTILVIFTSGKLADLEETKHVIKEASSTPLSIVFVGVGDGDFDNIHFLMKQEEGYRNIATFIKFNSFADKKLELSKILTKSIPHQIVTYFLTKGLCPTEF